MLMFTKNDFLPFITKNDYCDKIDRSYKRVYAAYVFISTKQEGHNGDYNQMKVVSRAKKLDNPEEVLLSILKDAEYWAEKKALLYPWHSKDFFIKGGFQSAKDKGGV